MRLPSIAILTATLAAAGASAATFHVDADSLVYSSAPGTIVTVTVTMTSAGETVGSIRALAIQVGWDPTVLKVAGSNPPQSFGRSAQSQMIPGLSGNLAPYCATNGSTAGNVCTVITQANATGSAVVVPAGTVVIGTLLLEVLGGALSGSDLGLSIGGYMNDRLMDPASDPNLTLGSNFTGAILVNPEPATGALLAVGLVGLGLAGRRRGRRS